MKTPLIALLLLMSLVSAAAPQDAVHIGKNHELIKRMFRSVIAQANKSTARVFCDGEAQDVALATIVSPDGYLLTRASSLSGSIVCQLADGRRLKVERVAVIAEHDLVLLRVRMSGLQAVAWRPNEFPPVGSLLATSGRGPDPVAIGVVSGLKTIATSVNTPVLLQHDSLLRSNDCGGPLVDLSGRAVGINLAREDRVTTYAVPAQIVMGILKQFAIDYADAPELRANGLGPHASARASDATVLKELEAKVQKAADKAIACTVGLRTENVMGSGVLVSRDGLVVTAAHVWQGVGSKVDVLLSDGRVVRGTCLGANHEIDAAFVKIDSNGLWSYADKIGRDASEGGEWCVATGHPHGYHPGRAPVLRLGRVLRSAKDGVVTDCTLTVGDSGGPLFDVEGRLIAVHSKIGQHLASNLHVPVDLIRQDWDRLVKGDAWGTQQMSLGPPMQKGYLGVSGGGTARGVRVTRVHPTSPAAEAGLRRDDVIRRFDKREIHSFDVLARLVRDKQPGSPVLIQVHRGERTITLNVTIGPANK